MNSTTTQLAALVHRRRRWLYAAGSVLALVAAVVVATPYALHHEMVAWLEDNGAQAAKVDRAAVDWFARRVTVSGVEFRDPAGRAVRLDRIALAIDLRALWHRRIRLESIEIADGALDIERTASGQFRLPEIPAASSSGGAKEPPRWQFGADSIVIDRLTLRVRTADGDETLTIDRARLTGFASWATDSPTAIEAVVTQDKGRIEIGGEALPLAPTPSAKIDLSLRSFDLAGAGRIAGSNAIAGTATGKLAIHPSVTAGDAITLRIEGSLSLDHVKLAAAGSPSVDEVKWSGDAMLESNPAAANTSVRIRGRVTLQNATDDWSPGEGFALKRAKLADLDARLALGDASGARVDLAAAVDLNGLAVRSGNGNAGAEQLHWKGALGFAAPRDGSLRLEADGTMTLQSGAFRATKGDGATSSEVSIGHLAVERLKARLERDPGGALSLDASGAVETADAAGGAPDARFQNQSLAWDGSVAFKSAPDGPPTATIDGEFTSKGVVVDLPADGFKVSQREAHWRGKAAFRGDAPAVPGALTMEAAATSQGTRIDATKLGVRLLEAAGLALDGITVDSSGDVAVSKLSATGLKTGGPIADGDATADAAERLLATIGAMTAEGLSLSGKNRIAARRIAIDDADIALERGKDGELRLVNSFFGLGQRSGDGAEAEWPREAPIVFLVGDWVLGGKSRLEFVDRSVEPAAQIVMSSLSVHLHDLDSSQPRRQVPIQLAASLGRYAKLKLDGTIRPFAERLDIDVTGKLNAFELTTLSGYASQYLGYDLTRGRLDTNIRAKVVDGKLQSTSRLTISKLSIAERKSDAAASLQKRLELPIETALSLLQDSKDVIRITVPVTGNIDSPEFDFSDAINTAIGNALKRTILTTVTIAFPLGAIIMAVTDSDGSSSLRFNPVVFEPGAASLDAKAKSYLDTVAALLEARPAVRITVCGQATESDSTMLAAMARAKALAEAKQRAAEKPAKAPAPGEAPKAEPAPEPIVVAREALLELGRQRSEAVKDFLIGERQIKERRVFLCTPKIASEPGAKPQADILL